MTTRKGHPQQAGKRAVVRDKLWLWSHDAGAHNKSWGLPKPSRITPVEAAFYLGIPNVIMVRYKGRPPLPLDQYTVPFRALAQVVWSVVGAGGQTDEKERTQVLELAAREANITGVMMDDFFVSKSRKGSKQAAFSIEELRELRDQLAVGGRRLNLWAVLYEHQLEQPLAEYLGLLDKVTFWTWHAQKLKGLKDRFERLEKLAPRRGKVLGCYLWDYSEKKPMPLELMQHQCDLGLQWLRKGRIEGIILLASCVCDLELEAVEWIRNWIAKVGEREL